MTLSYRSKKTWIPYRLVGQKDMQFLVDGLRFCDNLKEFFIHSSIIHDSSWSVMNDYLSTNKSLEKFGLSGSYIVTDPCLVESLLFPFGIDLTAVHRHPSLKEFSFSCKLRCFNYRWMQWWKSYEGTM